MWQCVVVVVAVGSGAGSAVVVVAVAEAGSILFVHFVLPLVGRFGRLIK